MNGQAHSFMAVFFLVGNVFRTWLETGANLVRLEQYHLSPFVGNNLAKIWQKLDFINFTFFFYCKIGNV